MSRQLGHSDSLCLSLTSLRSPFIHPNDGFKVQLANYEVSVFGSSSVITNAGKDWDFYEWNR
jgi:hypothetical protein